MDDKTFIQITLFIMAIFLANDLITRRLKAKLLSEHLHNKDLIRVDARMWYRYSSSTKIQFNVFRAEIFAIENAIFVFGYYPLGIFRLYASFFQFYRNEAESLTLKGYRSGHISIIEMNNQSLLLTGKFKRGSLSMSFKNDAYLDKLIGIQSLLSRD